MADKPKPAASSISETLSSLTRTFTTTTTTASSLSSSGVTTAGLGLNLNADKPPVVLEFGRCYTRAGFASEHVPRAIIPTTVALNGRSVALLQDFHMLDAVELQDAVVDFLFHVRWETIVHVL
jgi:hypothetical protein